MSLFRPAVFCLVLAALTPLAPAQPEPSAYVRGNSFGILFAYSNDSSHILFGQSEQRKLLSIGVSYSRRLIAGRIVNFQYDAELLPVALESDPLTRSANVQTSPTQGTFVIDGLSPMIQCSPFVNEYNYTINDVTYSGVDTFTCHGRRWTMGESIAPAGLQFNFLPRHKVQLLIESHGGTMFATRTIPTVNAGSFNFTVDAGMGFEYFRTPRQSVRVECRYHHISNHDTSFVNPGIDNGLFQVAYVFGR
ncbi:MAG TPA: acyloxyacyl hydrolase [Terracidiphilus sp.]